MKERHFSIQSRLRTLSILQVTICTLLFLFLSASRVNDTYHNYEQGTAQAATLFSATVFGFVDDALEVSKYPARLNNGSSSFTFIAQALQKGNLQGNLSFCKELYSYSKSTLQQYPFLDTIGIYEPDGDAVYVTQNRDSYYLTKAPKEAVWLQAVLQSRGKSMVFSPTQREPLGLPMLFDDQIVVARAVFNPIKLKAQGVIVITMQASSFDRIFEGFRSLPEQEYTLMTDQTPLLEQFSAADWDSTQTFHTKLIRAEGTLYLQSSYHYNEQRILLIRAPFWIVLSAVFKINILMLLSLAVILGLFMVLIRRMIGSILTPLQKMTAVLNSTTDANFPMLKQEGLPTDLEPLFSAYNQMSTRIDLLVNEGLRKDIAKREIEMQFLRTQINPHYLYNTLECIHMRAFCNKDYDVARMAELLGANLQYGLRDTNSRVSLRTECEKANEYIQLISYHYGNRIQFVQQMDEALLECNVMKLLLQPLIENAIQHGLPADRKLTIEILGYRTENDVCLQVSDDGNGMTPQAVQILTDSLQSEENANAIGLRNVHRRLRLRYGMPYGVSIKSCLHQSTVVTLSFPFEDAKEV